MTKIKGKGPDKPTELTEGKADQASGRASADFPLLRASLAPERAAKPTGPRPSDP